MADNSTLPATGDVIAADEIGGVKYQRVKPVAGDDGFAIDVSKTNPMPMEAFRTDNLIVSLMRLVKLMESNAVVDAQQRQRITLDSIAAGVALPTVTTVTTVATVTTVTTVASVTNIAAVAGMDREQYINIAKFTNAQAIRPRLNFT